MSHLPIFPSLKFVFPLRPWARGAFLALLLASPVSAYDAPRKKLIHGGWERPDSADFLQYVREMEKTPYDGIILMLQGRDDAQKPVYVQKAFEAVPWKREWFQKNIEELKQVRSTRLVHNFLRIGTNPGNVDWFDDEGWAQIIDHWRIAAWIAREGNLKGICFDAEPYSPPFFQMKYQAQRHRDQYSFEAYEAKARERGRQLMEAIQSEYPGMTLFTFFMNSYNMKMLTGEALKDRTYSLYPAFINGWLDAALPEMKFVDGGESAYFYRNELDFLRGAIHLRQRALPLVAAENREKYLHQVRAGFGLYLDSYVKPKTSRYYQEALDGSRVARLSVNARYAAQASDEYVWTWGEEYRWWPTKTVKVKPESWDEILPGASKALLAAFNPARLHEEAEQKFQELQASGNLKNLLENGDLSAMANTQKGSAPVPANWNPWQNTRGKRGTLVLDTEVDRTGDGTPGSGRIAGVAVRGSLGQSIVVRPGEVYRVSGWLKSEGKGHAHIRVRWKDKEENWLNETDDTLLAPTGNRSQGEWHEVAGIVVVPGEAGRMSVFLCAFDQTTIENAAWFDDLAVYELESGYE